jgi:hypothetical protein
MRRPEGLNEEDLVSIKLPFPLPHLLSSLLSPPFTTKAAHDVRLLLF